MMKTIKELCTDVYIHQKNEDLLFLEAKEDSYVVAQEFYFAMEDPNTLIIVPKIYWDTHQQLYPHSLKLVNYFLTSVGYEISPSYYELEHDDYDNQHFMLESGFVENLALLNIVEE